ncbi:hypothetical protein DXT99_06320 [Pontibacter diazotrophicus]|uniref:Uncharacterized protein n=1 Tax=Pontibacter diazotrophicus TaxID=1400979 RepID=A0A3D8LFA5_9BACT|nr:hypothetical protein [Pontibacter diazotrophicus]RDV15986.1 hypothetical protein DXT99_06320 [Pontibacter diazotrophicus]
MFFFKAAKIFFYSPEATLSPWITSLKIKKAMKNTPAVFLTSLAVSAISLTVPLPAASTVIDLFIGEEIAVQDQSPTDCESRQHTISKTDVERSQYEHKSASDQESIKLLRCLSEQRNLIKADSEAAFPLISRFSFYYADIKRMLCMPEGNQLAVNQHEHLPHL